MYQTGNYKTHVSGFLAGPLFLAFIIICLTSFSVLADEPQKLNLKDRTTIQEVNRILDESSHQVDAKGHFYFGFDIRSNPQEDARQYLPFLDYLNRTTGYAFKLRFSSKHSTVSDDLGTGKTDFAAIGAVSFIEAREKYNVISLVRGINHLGRSEYQSFIITAPDSDIKKISDLRGKRFAFGSITSTQGHLIPRILLAEEGIGLDDLADYEYTGSHQNCANAVIDRGLDACGMQDTMARSLDEQGRIRILHISRFFPSSGIAANKDVPAKVLESVRQAMLDFDPADHDKATLYHWDQTEMPNGFKTANETDYQELQAWLLRLELMGRRGPKSSQGQRR